MKGNNPRKQVSEQREITQGDQRAGEGRQQRAAGSHFECPGLRNIKLQWKNQLLFREVTIDLCSQLKTDFPKYLTYHSSFFH